MGALRTGFGRRVQQLRRAMGLTQEQLAKRAELDYKYLGGVERGERNLTIDNVEKIVRGLGIEPYEAFLFAEPAEPAKPPSDEVVATLLRRIDPGIRPLVLSQVQGLLEWFSRRSSRASASGKRPASARRSR